MLFSSISFLFYFLPAVLICYFLVPKQLKNTVLLFFSLLFYGWGEPKYVFIMLATIFTGYVFGILIGKYRGKKQAKVFLFLCVAIILGLLGYFKYAGFLTENLHNLLHLPVPVLKVALPIGISFYSFQILSYDVDVYRGNVPAQRNIIDLAAYISMFPQLIAGPIVRYADINEQLKSRTHTMDKAALGARRFVLGLSKKVLIANALGELCNIFRDTTQASVLYYWLYAIAFALHIYFDFSGYSDMAVGLGKIFGFDFMENFNYPYISASITEFWRRWHMSLGRWFRDYVYIPLGGNRVGWLKWFRNIFVVWMLTGLWHGASWNFVIWGLYFAVFLVLEKLVLLKLLEKRKIISHIYVMFLVVISFVIFNGESLSQVGNDLAGMFGALSIPFFSQEFLYELRNYGVVLLLAAIGASPLPKMICEKIDRKTAGHKFMLVAEPLVLAFLFVLITANLVDGSFNPFLYFRF